MHWGSGASTAPVRSISAAAAGAWPIQIASRSALTSSLVRPVLTLCGWSSASQPSTARRVALVDEQPLVALVVLEGAGRGVVALAPAAAGPDDREAAVELLAVEHELELAVRDRGRGVERRRLRLPGAPVPDDDVAGAVLLRRDDALEVEVLDRVVLDVDGHPADVGVEGQALGDRPGDEDALDLEAEVVVEPGRPMALDDEAARRTGPAAPGVRPAPAPGSSRSRACGGIPRGAWPECATVPAAVGVRPYFEPMASDVPHPQRPARPDRSRRDRDRGVAGDRRRDRRRGSRRPGRASSCTTVADRAGRDARGRGDRRRPAARRSRSAPSSTPRRTSTRFFRPTRRPARTGRHPGQQRRPELPAPPARRDLAGRVAGDVPRQHRVDVPVHAGGGGRACASAAAARSSTSARSRRRTRPATTATTTARRPRSSPSPGPARRSSGRRASGSTPCRPG